VFCTTPNARVSFWVGLDGNGTPTVEQAGTVAVCGDAAAPLYYKAFWEMYAGADSSGAEPFAVSPGDIIEASVTYTSGSYVLTLSDLTTGRSFSTTQSCSATVVCKRGTAEWIVERPGGGKYPLADFGKIKFSSISFASSGGSSEASNIEMVHADTILSICSPDFLLVTHPGDFGSGIRVVTAIACNWVAAE
jgi:Peptidase A4 family